jgi:glycosyltransferase involved in cell wall biosynthesis
MVAGMSMTTEDDLVVFSHLRWTGVWQRPQQLISRLAAGRRTWFVEEPQQATVSPPRLRTEEHGDVIRVWVELAEHEPTSSFSPAAVNAYATLLPTLLDDAPSLTGWLYTPLALELASQLGPDLLVYDVMDDLASFRAAPIEMLARHQQALQEADLVLAGGRSLHHKVLEARTDNVHLFPSGVATAHFAAARHLRDRRPVDRTRTCGYVGVIDERVDLPLVAELADRLPDWEVQLVGPIVKIDAASLPRRPNLTYLGPQRYEDLPDILGGFDVALMPFCLNDATRSISPTKTLEYLAAGLPVVSTRVPDVVAEGLDAIDLRDDASGFATACRAAPRGLPDPHGQVQRVLDERSWDRIAIAIGGLMADAAVRSVHGANA